MLIKYGEFNFNGCILKKAEPSKYIMKDFDNGRTPYSLYVYKKDDQEEEDFFIVSYNCKGVELTHAERYKTPLQLKGSIYKNPKTHKTVFIIDDLGFMKYEE